MTKERKNEGWGKSRAGGKNLANRSLSLEGTAKSDSHEDCIALTIAGINLKGIGLPATKSADLCIRETFVGRMRCGSNAKTMTFIPAGVTATERKATLQLSVKLIGSDRCQTVMTEKRTWAIAP